MKSKKGKVIYSEEPRDTDTLPEGSVPLTREQESAHGLPPPEETKGVSWKRTQRGDTVTLVSRRGGARPGAGRKPKGHVRLQIVLPEKTRAKVRHLARKRGATQSEIVAEAIDAMD